MRPAVASVAADTPFHAGERAAQARMGVEEVEDWARKVVRPFMPDQHREFFAALPFIVAAARDGDGRPWATLLAGDEDFIASPDPKTLAIETRPAADDPAAAGFAAGAEIGLLGIDFAARRRNRVNGLIADETPSGFQFQVGQSFGNCPQHISPRPWRRVSSQPAPARRSDDLSPAQRDWIAGAEAFFIASGHVRDDGHPSGGLDVSHRGGPAGFVQTAPGRIVFPDFAGNKHYNTVGNLLLDERVGLVFVDFESGGLLQIAGRARIDWDSDAVAATPGAERLIEIVIEAVVERAAALPLRWRPAAAGGLALRLAERVSETDDVVSFLFSAADGGALPNFTPGQHLPLDLAIPGVPGMTQRTYTLSGRTASGGYRISVKRHEDGLASAYLHDELRPGMTVAAAAPAGDFAAPDSTRPLLLVSAGVGATPMIAILQALADAGDRRPVLYAHGARDPGSHAFRAEAVRLADAHAPAKLLTAYSRTNSRLTPEAVLAAAGTAEADVMLCGPTAFVADMEAGLARLGVAPARIQTESFG